MEMYEFRGEIVKKILLSLIFLFLLTGCTAEYKLDIGKTSIEETISINVDSEKLGTEGIKIIENHNQLVFDDKEEYYESTFNQTDDNFNVNYNYTYDNNTIESSSFINKCYSENSIVSNENTLTISTEGKFNCYNMYGNEKLENTRIVISTDLEVIDNNADEIEGNNYIWIINENNYYDKPIFIEIDKTETGYNSLFLILPIVIVFAILIGIIVSIVRIRYRKSNEL